MFDAINEPPAPTGVSGSGNPLAGFSLNLDEFNGGFSPFADRPQPTPEEQRETIAESVAAKTPGGLYFDLETIPDETRLHLFDLPPLPGATEFTPESDLLSPSQFIDSDVKTASDWLKPKNPPPEWLDQVEQAEREGKARKGMLALAEAKRAEYASATNAETDQIKKLSLSPFHCRIVAIGAAFGLDSPPTRRICRTIDEEREALVWLWSLWEKCRPAIGFHINCFDIPVLLARSAILKIAPPFLVDRRKWGSSDYLDLYEVLFSSGQTRGPNGNGLKATCKALGLEDDDAYANEDGSQVYGLVQAGRWDELMYYVGRDVERVQRLHRFIAGIYCI